jgi:hypothetical protein
LGRGAILTSGPHIGIAVGPVNWQSKQLATGEATWRQEES